jgi:hypothetical protein
VAPIFFAAPDGFAFEILQHEVVDAVLMADVEQRANARVAERGDRARFTIEAISQPRIGSERRRQDLDGDGAIEPRVTGAIDLAHAARAEGRNDLIGAQAATGLETHPCVWPRWWGATRL